MTVTGTTATATMVGGMMSYCTMVGIRVTMQRIVQHGRNMILARTAGR